MTDTKIIVPITFRIRYQDIVAIGFGCREGIQNDRVGIGCCPVPENDSGAGAYPDFRRDAQIWSDRDTGEGVLLNKISE